MTRKNHDSIVYILGSSSTPTACRLSYVGVSNNLHRRLRQHTQRIQGGARYTKRSSQWYVMAVVGGLPSRQAALQLEWALKRVRGGGRGSMSRRVHALWTILSRERGWTRQAPCTKDVWDSIWVWWNPTLIDLAQKNQDWTLLPPSVQPNFCLESIWEYLYP